MNFARYFKKHGDVDLLYLSPGSKPGNSPSPFRKEHCIKIVEEDEVSKGNKEYSGWHHFKQRVARIAERRPATLTEWPPEAAGDMEALLMDEGYDIILCRYIHNSFPLFGYPAEIRKRIIIDFDDYYPDVDLGWSPADSSNTIRKFKYIVERYLIANYQQRCLDFGAVLVCSEKDRAAIASSREIDNLFVIPNSFPEQFRSARSLSNGNANINVLLFVGTLNYGPNADGIEWFIKNIFPELQKVHDSLKLLIVGRDPEERVKSLCKGNPGIELHANVPEMEPYYDRCGIVVVPILSGGGTRIKILEAGMAGRVVFSTPTGAYGLDVADGMNIMLFTDHASFLDRYERIKERTAYERIKDNLKDIVETKYSPEAFQIGMNHVTNHITAVRQNSDSTP